MGIIILNNIRVYAHHGCLTEETIIGSYYAVDVAVKTNLKKAAKTDNLSDTIDYVLLNKIVKEEMAIPSELLEHVAQRMINRFFLEIEILKKVKVTVSKINPPIGGDVASVSVVLKEKRA